MAIVRLSSPRLLLIGIAACAAMGATIWLIRHRAPSHPASEVATTTATEQRAFFVGSSTCRECHARFYQLWSTSHHGLAMQPYTQEFALAHLPVKKGQVKTGQPVFEVDVAAAAVSEQDKLGRRSYPILHVLGGKNVYYFLTQLDRGRLQTLPLAWDVRKKEWFDTQASAMRHFADSDSILPWTDPAYTFNTSCYSCHVSQLSANYDEKSDRYHTIWAEPGINCETCHGPAADHVKAARALKPGEAMIDSRLISARHFTPEQHNATCAPCHAKMNPLTGTYKPGDRYFDHFDLATLEDPDFYPDGRDLGENYTFTLWRMNPCAVSGPMHCVQCHTSSGRYRFKTENPNDACMPCHQKLVADSSAHSHHQAGTAGDRCIDCHMPTTEFARMRRTDHSLRPPAPAATLAFKSPNACNICHSDKDASWADAYVREWYFRDYQAPILHRGHLLAAARKGDWSRLPEMLHETASAERDEIYATSLIRLLARCSDERKWTAIRQAMNDKSPLVRSAAASALRENLDSPEARQLLVAAARDDYRLVRVRAAGALAPLPPELIDDKDRSALDAATAELAASFGVRLDDWSSHYNFAGLQADRGNLPLAIEHYQRAAQLRPDTVLPLVNVSLLYAQVGQRQRAAEVLGKALKLDPANAAANFNMGLLQAELSNPLKAEEHLRAALKADPAMAEAAYNLGVLLVPKSPQEALSFLRQACALRAKDPRFLYTLAFYLNTSGNPDGAAEILQALLLHDKDNGDAHALLAAVYEQTNQIDKARAVYREAIANGRIQLGQRKHFEDRLRQLGP
ncbi:MAG: ammonia-forming cytochrome c nitrite reductase subunit c552 [Planctomycetota bacterium]|nr:ammonia-forming cytochrome c nitrite reductase subunit c552 [Planctomycetota bacterium]